MMSRDGRVGAGGSFVRKTVGPVLLVASILCAFGEAARAQDVLTDAYTSVAINASIPADRGTLRQTTIDGSTSYSDTILQHPLVPQPGQYDAEGFASFTTLRAKGELFGPSATTGRTDALFNQLLTPTGGTAGTDDFMTFVFGLDGAATVDLLRTDFPQEIQYATARLTATTYSATDSQGTVLGMMQKDFFLPPGGPGTAFMFTEDYGDALLFDVPFTYGETFNLHLLLNVWAFHDNLFPAVIDRVDTNFFNTAELIAIVNQNNPTMLLAGKGFDYTPFVTDTLPPGVPEPAGIVLVAIGLAGLAWHRRGSGLSSIG